MHVYLHLFTHVHLQPFAHIYPLPLCSPTHVISLLMYTFTSLLTYIFTSLLTYTFTYTFNSLLRYTRYLYAHLPTSPLSSVTPLILCSGTSGLIYLQKIWRKKILTRTAFHNQSMPQIDRDVVVEKNAINSLDSLKKTEEVLKVVIMATS